MAGRLLPGVGVRVRRGRRHDLPELQTLLGAPSGRRDVRDYRRHLADLGADVYVAEDASGTIVALVSVAYARSFVRGGVSALLDGVRARPGTEVPLIDGLIAFAEERARRRGCRRLAAWVEPDDATARAAFLARGYRPGTWLETELVGASA
jgi:GNAT superfamily N-acetyltransferase